MIRGRKTLRRIDTLLGPPLVFVIGKLARLRRLVRPSTQESSATLVFCSGMIGDLLLVSAVMQHLHPDRRVLLACTPENRAAASVFPDLYSTIIDIQLSRPWSLAQSISGLEVAKIVDATQWANVSAIQVGLVKVTRPSIQLTGFATSTRSREAIYDRLIPHSSLKHEAENFAALLGVDDFDRNRLIAGSPSESRKTVLHLWPSGTRSHLKEWPLEHWAELARRLYSSGREIFVSGGPADLERNDSFRGLAAVPITNLAGKSSLSQLYQFLRNDVGLCITVNTGTMHLAALAGTRVVAITGPTKPERWGPVGPYSISVLPTDGNVAYLNYGFEYPDNDEEAYALDRLSVDEVLAAIADLERRG